MPSRARCRGCGHEYDSRDLQQHVVGCTRLHGYNASSRHAAVNQELHSVLHDMGATYEQHEPREFSSFACTGCMQSFDSHDDAAAHMLSCCRVDSLDASDPKPRPRRCGPDGRVFVSRVNTATNLPDAVPVVYDITIVSPAAPSYVGRKVDAWDSRVRDKTAKYEKAVTEQRPGQTLAVVGGTCYGALSEPTIAFLREVLKSCPSSCVLLDEVRRRLSSAIVFSSGALLLNAERAIGIRHATSALQCNKTHTARKGTVGAVADAIARAC
jgi:hypothetical protein